MGVRVQFNPSTGNASFNASTGKVQVIGIIVPDWDCDMCDVDLTGVELTTTGIVACCAPVSSPPGSSNTITGPLGTYINVTDLSLIKVVDECIFSESVSVPSNTLHLVNYSTSDCSGAPAFSPQEILAIKFDYTLTQTVAILEIFACFDSGCTSVSTIGIYREGITESVPWDCFAEAGNNLTVFQDCNNSDEPTDLSGSTVTIARP